MDKTLETLEIIASDLFRHGGWEPAVADKTGLPCFNIELRGLSDEGDIEYFMDKMQEVRAPHGVPAATVILNVR